MSRSRAVEPPEWIVVVPVSLGGQPIAAAVEGLFPRVREVAESLAGTHGCCTTLLRRSGGQYVQTGCYQPPGKRRAEQVEPPEAEAAT